MVTESGFSKAARNLGEAGTVDALVLSQLAREDKRVSHLRARHTAPDQARNTTAMPAEMTVRPMRTMAPLLKNSDMTRSEDCRCVPAQRLRR